MITTSNKSPATLSAPAGRLRNPGELGKVLAQHDDVAALWYVGSAKGSTVVERESSGSGFLKVLSKITHVGAFRLRRAP